MNLDGRVAIVTGAGTGIGRAIAELFAREGARVVVNYSRSREAAEEVVSGIRSGGGTAVALAANVAKRADVNELMSATEQEFGRLDYLINNAGWSTRVPHQQLDDLTDEIWDRTLNTNLRGAFYCARAAAPFLRKQAGAAIVNIASVAGVMGVGSSIAYAASKGGMITMTKSLARVLAPAIRVNAVLPGFVRTRFAGWDEPAFSAVEKTTPLHRLATAEEIALAALFFAAMATGTSGETLLVDGGITPLGTRTA
jgi:3-oxoacyl-[acyl-carrier protein] reductase